MVAPQTPSAPSLRSSALTSTSTRGVAPTIHISRATACRLMKRSRSAAPSSPRALQELEQALETTGGDPYERQEAHLDWRHWSGVRSYFVRYASARGGLADVRLGGLASGSRLCRDPTIPRLP